jgi:hypothetical protein
MAIHEPQRASTVTRIDSDCSCEAHTASQWSPGPVADGDALARLIFSPIHFDEATQTIKAAAFDDCTGQGLSVERLGCSSLEQLQARAEAKAANDRQRGPRAANLGVGLNFGRLHGNSAVLS